ncbi:MAG TPA: ECF-type sigma factor [Verrucomicrobiota bacterium]|nr:ECF-type sigma factor [Verrucomicrobiota bacterium]
MRPNEVTELCAALRSGESQAAVQLFELVYTELRRIAAQEMAHEAANHTMQATALVHEAWLRLGADSQPPWQNRAHFFAAAAEAMRRILVDRSRRKLARCRGGGVAHEDVDELEIAAAEPVDDAQLIALNEALDRFAALDPKKAELVKLRYFVGLTVEQSAPILDISEPTAKRWWAYSKAWLYRELSKGAGG